MNQKIENIGDNYHRLIGFCRFLVRVDNWTADEILSLLESPYRWQAEYTFYYENQEDMDSGKLTNGD